MNNEFLEFKKKFFAFLAIAFGTVFATSLLVVGYLVSGATDDYKKAELESTTRLYTKQFKYVSSSVVDGLRDIAGKNLVVNPLMEFNRGDLSLRDFLEDQRLVGLKGKFTVLGFDGELLYGEKRLSDSKLKALISKEQNELVEMQDNTVHGLLFAVPIKYNGIPEGALVFETNISLERFFGVPKKSHQLILNKGGLTSSLGNKELERSIVSVVDLPYGFELEIGQDLNPYLWSQYSKMLKAWLVLLVFSLGLGFFFYRKGKVQFVNPHQELMRARRDLEEAASLNQLIVNSLNHLVISTDPGGMILSVNDQAEKVLGYDKSELIGLETPLLWHEKSDFLESESNEREVLNLLHAFLKKAMFPNEAEPYTWTVYRKNGASFKASLIARAIELNDQTIGYVFVIEDLTSKILHLEKDREAVKAIEKAAEVKSEFLANMSHEIRTPMNGILGMLNMLTQTALTKEQRDMLRIVKSSGDGLMTILNDILDLSKIDAGKLDLELLNFSIIECVEEAVSLSMHRAREKSLSLSYDIDDSTPEFLYGDITRIRQVIVNLLSNAVKFTNEGEVKVKVSADLLKNSNFRVKIAVIDSGIGISEEDQKKLFSAFSQADASITRKFGGTGLGLAIISKLAKVMEGTIDVQSAPGEGSTFTLELELKEGEIPRPEAQASNSVEVNSGPTSVYDHRILVAEDNAINQKLITMMLERLGYTSDIVGNGLEALQAIERTKNLGTKAYTIIFMDMQMPEMDGITATKEIIKKYAEDRPLICAMTANAFKEDRDRCLEAGMDGFVAKPVQIEELAQVIDLYGASLELDQLENIEPEKVSQPEQVKHVEASVQADQPLVNLPFDKPNLLNSFVGDEDILYELVGDFGEQWPRSLQEMREGIATDDIKSVEILAHTLKGLTGTFKAEKAKIICLEIESQAKAGDLKDTLEFIDALEEELNALQSELGKMAS